MTFTLDRLRPRRRGPSLDFVAQTEHAVVFCRVLLAATTLAIAIVDPVQPSYLPGVGFAVLGGYLGFSAALFWMVRGQHVRGRRVGPYSLIADIFWIFAITLFTDRGATPFFLLNVFVISSASVRWGFAVSGPVTIFLALMYPAVIFFASHFLDPEAFIFHRAQLFRPAYLVALGYLIGYIGEHERCAKGKLRFMLQLTTASRRDRAVGWGLTRLMSRVMHYFGAQRGVLVLCDPETGHFFTWDVNRRNDRPHVHLRISKDDSLALSLTSPTEALIVNLARSGRSNAHCYDVATRTMHRKTIESEFRLPDGDAIQSALVVPVLIQRQLRGHAVVTRDGRRRFTRDELEFLLLIVGQTAMGFEAARLQEKAEEVAVLEERARIARDLHDGFIQSLAGIDLRLEACRNLVNRDPSRVPRQLEELQQMVDRGYRDVRHYLRTLRSASRRAEDLSNALDQIVAEFAIRDRLHVDLVLPATDPGLPASSVHEMTQITREALHNAVRHGHATRASVTLSVYPSHCHVVVRDNGRGFQNVHGLVEVDGYVAAAAAPWSIRDRTAALGGVLRIRSEPGIGAEVSVIVPVGARANGTVTRSGEPA